VLLNSLGTVAQGNGTSFSAPIISGLAACLWQKHPTKTNHQVRQAILESASHYYNPDNDMGYGIPNFQVADYLLSFVEPITDTTFLIYPNPFSDKVYIRYKAENYPQQATLHVTSYAGRTVINDSLEIIGLFTEVERWHNLRAGVYVFRLEINGTEYQQKMVKISR
jgi:subtilisin family serine protease